MKINIECNGSRVCTDYPSWSEAFIELRKFVKNSHKGAKNIFLKFNCDSVGKLND